MNLLHWGMTLENKRVRINSRPYTNYNYSSSFNFSDYKVNSQKYYYIDDTFSRNSSNGTYSHAQNQFLKKSRVLTDMMTKTVRTQSFTTVVVIASIFLFLTMTISAAVAVFCRKRNSVFALQKSEQEDIDYELEELNTDIEYTETEFESETESIKPQRRSRSQRGSRSGAGSPGGDSDLENSPARRPLVSVQRESEVEDSPIRYHRCQCGATADPRGAYQQMVVTAVLEKPHHHPGSASEDSDNDLRTRYIEKLKKTYYGFATVTSDVDSDHEGYPINMRQPPMINITYVDDPPSYESIQHASQQQVQVEIENCHAPSRFRQNPMENKYSMDGYSEKWNSDAAVVFVELPPVDYKKKPLQACDQPVVFVDLPPKPDAFSDEAAVKDPLESQLSAPTSPCNSTPVTTPAVTPAVTPIMSPTQTQPPLSITTINDLPKQEEKYQKHSPQGEMALSPLSPIQEDISSFSETSGEPPSFGQHQDETDSSSDQEHTHSTALTTESHSSQAPSDMATENNTSPTDSSNSKSDSEPG